MTEIERNAIVQNGLNHDLTVGKFAKVFGRKRIKKVKVLGIYYAEIGDLRTPFFRTAKGKERYNWYSITGIAVGRDDGLFLDSIAEKIKSAYKSFETIEAYTQEVRFIIRNWFNLHPETETSEVKTA